MHSYAETFLSSLQMEAKIASQPFWSSAKVEGFENPPPYTDGPSRVILANDGTKDRPALLMTPDLVAALSKTTDTIRKLQRKDGALESIESEIIDLAGKADNVEETIRNPRHQDRAEEMQLGVGNTAVETARSQRAQLPTENHPTPVPFESRLTISTYQSQGLFEEA